MSGLISENAGLLGDVLVELELPAGISVAKGDRVGRRVRTGLFSVVLLLCTNLPCAGAGAVAELAATAAA